MRLGHHLVLFLDVLGQRDRFRGLALPKDNSEQTLVQEVLRQTAGFVLGLRDLFRTQFTLFEQGANASRFSTEPLSPNLVGFSDSFVVSVPLRHEGDDLVPIVRVFSALSAAATMMLTSLASKHGLRGGVDVGLAVELTPGEIYGTALERAYLLEHNVAQYPRIVIGEELWNYLNSVLRDFGNRSNGRARAITAIAQKCIGLIAKDSDGQSILNYLGPVIVENSVPAHKDSIIRPAYEFVLAEEQRLTAAGNLKLVKRYSLIRQYFESKLHLWGVK